MTTAGKLWLGFGTLIAVLVLSSAAIVLRVGAIDGELQQMGQARDRSAIASQIEIGLLSYVLAVRTYVQTGAVKSVHDAAQNFVAVEYHLQRYRELAASEHQRLMADEFAALWQELKILGSALIDADNRRVTAEQSNRLHTIGADIKALLNSQLQADAVRTHTYRRTLAQDDAEDVAGFALLLLAIGTLVALVTSAAVAREVVRSEHDIRSSREKLRVTLASIGDAVVTTDSGVSVTYLNPMAARLASITPDDAIGRPLQSCFQLVDTVTRTPLDRLAPTGKAPSAVAAQTGEALLIGSDGKERPVDYSVTPIRDEAAGMAGMALTFRDVTERNRLESELRAHAAALSEADRRKDEFLAMLAHELRNPLAPLQNALEAMARADSTTPASASVSMMQRQLNHVVRLVDDLLDISRISRGEIALRVQDIELASVIDDAVEVAMPLCQAHGHRLSVDLPPHPVRMRADPIRLAQILGNLLNNACKFTPCGGHVELRVEAFDGHIEIRVRDNGIGIAQDMLSPIFDMFFQADTTSERVQNGSGIGMGLSLVRKLTELHGGSVSAHSAGAGQGSEFVVHLPTAIDNGGPTAVVTDFANAATVTTAPLRILIVDDNRDAAASLATLLELDGHHIRTVSDGNAAMDVAATWQPQAMLLDIGLPGFSGLEVARRIRGESWGGAIKLVAVTGWGQDSDRRQSLAAGFDAHLVKPVTYSELKSLLAKSSVPTS